MSQTTRRRFVAATVGAAGLGGMAGCTGEGSDGDAGAGESRGTAVQSSFFVFGDVAASVAGDAASADLLVPVGQHGHGWEPGPRVREALREADLFVHGMAGFQPWADDVVTDLEADGAGVATLDASADVSLLEAGGGDESDDHDEEDAADGDGHGDDDYDHGTVDPHFWMDPLRLEATVETVRDGLVEVDPDHEDGYGANAAAYRDRLADLHERLESTVAAGSTDVLLVAGHDSFQYLADRYDLRVEALTDRSPDDQPTPRDVERAQRVVADHDLQYVCADPLESQEAAEQLVAETDATAVLPLTAMPGLTDAWDEQGWGYVDVMENVNLPTIERALEAR